METKEFTKRQMRQRITAATFTGIFIGLLAVYLIIKSNDSNPADLEKIMGGIVDREKADKNLDAYRKGGSMTALSLFHKKQKLGGIFHDSTSLDSMYLIFKKFQNDNNKLLKEKNANYRWGLGLYPSIARGRKAGQESNDKPDSVARLCIYFIPTVYLPAKDGQTETVFDYVRYGKDSSIYPQIKLLTGADIYVYDQGTIFP